MGKLQKTATEKIKEILAEKSKIHKGYDNALTVAHGEYHQLEQEFREIEAQVKDVHKAYVLNQVTIDAYLQEKKRLKDADEKLRDAGYKLDEINKYRTEDLRELMTRMEEIISNYGKEKVTSEKKMRYKALKAKFEYLKTIHELAKEHGEVWKVSREFEDLRVELGLKKYNHVSFDSVFNSLLSNSYDGTQGVDITQAELQLAFYKGMFNKSFLDEIEKGKKAGFIQ